MVLLYLLVVLRHFRNSIVTSSDFKKKLKSTFHLQSPDFLRTLVFFKLFVVQTKRCCRLHLVQGLLGCHFWTSGPLWA